jgi:coproporphyrinogen III oxidase-like Fe-S oxidoreductase
VVPRGEAVLENVVATQELVDQPTGLYIHWPFCRRRCRYCDFAIVPIGSRTDQQQQQQDDEDDPQEPSLLDRNYTQAILQELQHAERQYSASRLLVRSIYFGGGTPSLAPIECLSAIFDFIHSSKAFVLADDCETTIEVDPGTFTVTKLHKLKNLGINRLSFGVQSFDDATLAFIGRTHRNADIQMSLEAIRQVFGTEKDGLNWSIDLISGLPGVSLAQWIETLERAVSMRPQPKHISVYDLQVEQVRTNDYIPMDGYPITCLSNSSTILPTLCKGTVFGNWYRNDDAKQLLERRPQTSSRRLPTPEDAAFMYKFAAGYLRAHHYEHYEVSSYAFQSGTDSFRSRHNQIYWANDGQWLAFGMGASSYMNGAFTVRPRLFRDYLDWADALPTDHDNSNDNDTAASNDAATFERLTDIVLKRLRTSDGLDLFAIRDRFGKQYCDAVLRGADLALCLKLATHDVTTGILRLSDPDGFLFSNSIISSVFVELEAAANDAS